MYIDKLDGRIDAYLFDKLTADLRQQQDRCWRAIARHQEPDQSYLEEGIHLLELGGRNHALFEREDPRRNVAC